MHQKSSSEQKERKIRKKDGRTEKKSTGLKAFELHFTNWSPQSVWKLGREASISGNKTQKKKKKNKKTINKVLIS